MIKYNIGDIISGKVTGIEKYGIFLSLADGSSGLIHISEISDQFVRNVSDYVVMGETIKARVIGYDENDEKVTLVLTDLPAICFQHEIDHLNGIMFYDHINKDNPFDVPEEYERL